MQLKMIMVTKIRPDKIEQRLAEPTKLARLLIIKTRKCFLAEGYGD